MRKFYMVVWPGMLALVLSGAVLAHERGGYGGYPYDGWAGNATVWVDSTGRSGYAGRLRYGVGYGYAPGYIPWLEQGHGPQCQHGPGHGYQRGYRHGRQHGRKHARKHRGRHH